MSEVNPLDSQTFPKKGIRWHEVTWYTITLSVIVFVGVLPALTYYFWTQYQEIQDFSVASFSVNTKAVKPVVIQKYLYPAITGARLVAPSYIVNTGDAYDDVRIVKIGEITEGKYTGWDLWLYKTNNESMKGSYREAHTRLLVKGKRVVFAPRISTVDSEASFGFAALEERGYSVSEDSSFVIPELEVKKEVVGADTKQVLVFMGNFYASYYNDLNLGGEVPGRPRLKEIIAPTFDFSLVPFGAGLYEILTASGSGTQFVTIKNLDESNESTVAFPVEKVEGFGNIYKQVHAPTVFQAATGTYPMFNEKAFNGQFFEIQPDGLVLLYKVKKDPGEPKSIGTQNFFTSYYFAELNRCQGDPHLDLYEPDVLPQSFFSATDLVEIAKTSSGKGVFAFRKDHPYLAQAYNKYKADLAEAQRNSGRGQVLPETIFSSLSEFANSYPYIFIDDGFGRYQIEYHRGVTYIGQCEPVIYLYPKTQTKVSVFLPETTPFKSIPQYSFENGWQVVATPESKLTVAIGKTYPYLFWEASSVLLPPPEKGFIVARGDVERFLGEKLSFLGLNKKEADDFKKAWLPQFTTEPYYFITFLPRETIDALAPLVISPKPDTTIRILMDFYPLEQPVKAQEPLLEKGLPRKGFTVVEWGGIGR